MAGSNQAGGSIVGMRGARKGRERHACGGFGEGKDFAGTAALVVFFSQVGPRVESFFGG